jgi:hypothetical protein
MTVRARFELMTGTGWRWAKRGVLLMEACQPCHHACKARHPLFREDVARVAKAE